MLTLFHPLPLERSRINESYLILLRKNEENRMSNEVKNGDPAKAQPARLTGAEIVWATLEGEGVSKHQK